MECRRIHSSKKKYLLAIGSFFAVLIIANNLHAACCIAGQPLGTDGCTPCGIGQTCDQSTLICKASGSITICPDVDGDGFTPSACGGTDCNDSNASINPNRAESCNGIDDNCDGNTDEGVKNACGGCGTITGGTSGAACDGSDTDLCTEGTWQCNTAKTNTTCSDATGNASEKCNDIDDDCDGLTDETYTNKGQSCSAGTGECKVTGKRICNTTGTGTVCNAVKGTPIKEICDSKDNDCDGSTDEGVKNACSGCGTLSGGTPNAVCDGSDADLCTEGKWTCNALKTDTTCSDSTGDSAEICDNKDNDCDGAIDEGFGTTTCGTGACLNTANNCSNGAIQACTPKTAGTETCNGIDDDCDGTTDEELGTTTCGTGACQNTVNNCSSGVAQACTPKAAGTETCNGIDDDCDGTIDEGLGTTTCGTGACQSTVDNCSNGIAQACTPKTAGAEACNNIDDDCDGTIDEDLIQQCGITDVGECSYGTKTCSNGSWGTCTGAIAPASETCDGKDNNCDGVTDEGFDTDGDGVTTCGGDCNDDFKSIHPGAAELCDGIDNDCEGGIDEGFPNKDAECTAAGIGQCQTGIYKCNADGSGVQCVFNGNKAKDTPCDDGSACTQTDICNVGKCYGSNQVKCSALDQCHDAGVCDKANGVCSNPVKTSGFDAEVCDGIDNDCDGQTDEELGNLSCGVGTCANTVSACVNGATQTCSPKSASVEACDGVDNDCDGKTDEGFCTIGDVCMQASMSNPSNGCQVCDPAKDQSNWTDRADGYPCDDGNACTTSDKCSAGICASGQAVQCLTPTNTCYQTPGTCGVGGCSYELRDYVSGPEPTAEICDGKDNDCDIKLDEGFDKGTECAVGLGECKQYGTKVCTADGIGTVCDAIAGPPAASESCDGKDNDCDGLTPTNEEDKDYDGYRGCAECNDKNSAVHPGAVEICDGLDNDCSGAIDDVAGAPLAVKQKGVCSGQTKACSGTGGWKEPDYSKITGYQSVESMCDGLDNDCDGTTDENYISTFTCGVGECANWSECLGGKETCIPNDDQKLDEMCDGMDNDCNGSVDDIAEGDVLGEQCKVNKCIAGEWQIVNKDGCVVCIDDDGDGVCADVDNCPLVSNLTQDDLDKDGIGNACDEPDCGNAYLESGEACDDGNDNNLDLCRNDCSQPTCGDGVKDAVTNEECESGVTALGAHQYCELCLIKTEKYCGDGKIDIGEKCDGKNLGGATCESLQHKGGGDISCGVDCAFVADCSDSLCGDGVRDEGEACDGIAGITDAIHQKCDSCNIIDVPPVCGNGVVDGTEECDGGVDCRATCMLVKCGDGIQDAGEACDKGSANSDTGECLSTCQIAECGDGFIKAGVEECDKSVLNSDVLPDACRTSCIAARCGDFVVDSTEACDDGKFNGDDGKCNMSCTDQHKYCGNGIKDEPNDQGWNEECDGSDGVVAGKVCNASCVLDDCANGDTRVCSTGLQGICAVGSETCEGGKWGECSQTAQAVAEVCNNGQDDDCDGLADGADGTDCGECQAGIVQACNITNEFGSCVGPKVCGADYKFGECQVRTPAAESCNGSDDDCDKLVDEDLERACSSACGVGVETCSSGEWRGCSAPQPEVEKCDNKDNDCDGAIDEDVKNACGTCGDVPAEVCDDGKDNNCDGVIDEDCVPIDVKKNISAGVGGVVPEDDRPESAVMPVCTSKIFDCSKTRAMKLPNDTADIKVLDDGKLIVVIDSKGQMAAVEMKQFGEGVPKAPVAKEAVGEEEKAFELECEDGKEALIEMKKSAEAANGFAFEGELEGCSVKSSEKSSVTINIGEKDIAIDVTKAGEIFGSEFNKSIGSGNFGVDEANIIAGGSDAIKIGKVDTAGNITALPEKDEKLPGCSEIDKICNNDSLHFVEPKFMKPVAMKNFGGADLMAMFTEKKSGDKYAFFYYNINEEPVVDVKQSDEPVIAPAEGWSASGGSEAKPAPSTVEGQSPAYTAVGVDPSNDELFYAWSCKDFAGTNCDSLLSTLEGETVSVIAPAEGLSASGGSEAKQSPTPDFSLNALPKVVDANTSAYQWPLTLTVTATDPGGLSASKSIQATKSGEMKTVAEAVPETPAPVAESAPPAESAAPFADKASISGGGCGGFFSVGGVERPDVNRVIALLWPLIGSILILLARISHKVPTAAADKPVPTASRSKKVLNVATATPPRFFLRAPF